MIIDMEWKGQLNQYDTNGSLAFCSMASWQRGLMRQTVNLRNGVSSPFAGSNPALAVSLKTALLVVRATTRAILGPKPKDGVSSPPSFWLFRSKKARAKMTCHNCETEMVKAGKYGRKLIQRFLCKKCGKRFSEPQSKPLGDVRLPMGKVTMILHCLVEGNSVRGTARLCDVEKRTVLNLLKSAGDHCEQLLENKLRGVRVNDLQRPREAKRPFPRTAWVNRERPRV